MKKTLGLFAASLLMATPAMADNAPPQNTDFNPSPGVGPGVYGQMSNPVTSKFKLSFGGYVKLDYAHNSETINGTSGIISPASGSIPAHGVSDANLLKDQSAMGINQSRVWLKADGPGLLGARTSALVEGDFYGGDSAGTESPLFRVRHAYGALDWTNTQVLFGQYWDAFAPMVASTQDFRCGSPYGSPNSPRIPQIRLTQRINLDPDNQLRFAVAVQDPAQTGDNNTTSTGGSGANVNYAGQVFYTNKYLGNAPGYFGQSMNPFTVGLFGLYGTERSPGNGGHDLDSYGYGAYAFVPVLKSKTGIGRAMTMSLEAQTYLAANMAFNGATETAAVGTPATAIGNPSLGSASTELQDPARNWAATAQLIFDPTQNLGLTGGWGARYAYHDADYLRSPSVVFQKYTQEVYANAAYDLNAAVRVAAEYHNLTTVYGNVPNIGRSVGADNTVRFCAYYFF